MHRCCLGLVWGCWWAVFVDVLAELSARDTMVAGCCSLFVCVEVLRPGQPNGVMSSAVSLPDRAFTGRAWSSGRLTSSVHVLSPGAGSCPSWVGGRERMTVDNIS